MIEARPYFLLQRALEVDARDVAVQALTRKDELGFNFLSLKAYRQAITHFSTKGDIDNVIKYVTSPLNVGPPLGPTTYLGLAFLRQPSS